MCFLANFFCLHKTVCMYFSFIQCIWHKTNTYAGLVNPCTYYRKRVNVYFYSCITLLHIANSTLSMLSVTEKIIRQLRNISIFHQFIFNSYMYTHQLEHDWSVISQTITFIDILSKNIFLNRQHKLVSDYGIYTSFSNNLEKRRKK